MNRFYFGFLLIMVLTFVKVDPLYAQCGGGVPSGGNPLCIPPDVYNGQGNANQQNNIPYPPQPIIIKHKWEDRWAAMVLDKVNVASGVFEGARTKEEALQMAKGDCMRRGGAECSDIYSYKNGCGAIVVINGGGGVYASASNEQEAIRHGMNICKREGKKCNVYYSGCSQAEAVPIR